MQKLYISPTNSTPEIKFSPEENIFSIKGNSSPEDVREMYYPVIEWVKIFVDDILDGENKAFTEDNPFKLQVDLEYFNSSSAKFLYDIFNDLKRLSSVNIPLIIEWYYDKEDLDMKDAGVDFSLLVETTFNYIEKIG
jgi:hypothetical protein